MNYNPYQAPQAVSPGGAPGGAVAMHGPQPWAVGEVISLASEGFKRSWLALAGSFFVAGFASAIPSLAPAILIATKVVEPSSVEYWTSYVISQIVGWLVGAFFMVGITRISLAVARGQEADFSMLFGGVDKFGPYVVQAFLWWLAIVTGLALLLVPALIVLLGLMLARFYVVDAGMGPVAALKESWRATTGHKGNLFILWLAFAGISVLGFIACCIGYFASASVCEVAVAIVYVRISGRGTAVSAYVPQAYPGYGPGYGGQ